MACSPRGELLVGGAMADITPPLGTHLSGGVAQYRPAEEVLDPLFARALVWEAGGKRAGVVAMDVTIVTGEYTAHIRQAAADRYEIPPDALMVHATQTHSAPSVGGFMLDSDFPRLPEEFTWLCGSIQSYADLAAERAIEAIGQAVSGMQPACFGAASGVDGRFAFNRRAIRRDGTVGMASRHWEEPVGPTWILYLEGPIDPELGLLSFRSRAEEPVAVVANYTCHPVIVFPRPVVSADWPGALADALRRRTGAGTVLTLNGACGNINPWSPFDPDYVQDHRRMGEGLADVANKVLGEVEYASKVTVDWAIEHVQLPVRQPSDEELKWATAVLEDSPEPSWADEARRGVSADWIAAASIYSVYLMRQRSETLDYEVQVLRIGDTALVGLPGEPFVELGLKIKMLSPTRPTYIVHCTSHYVGYIPIPEAYERGGHEVTTRYWAKLTPEAFDLVADAADRCLRRVFCK